MAKAAENEDGYLLLSPALGVMALALAAPLVLLALYSLTRSTGPVLEGGATLAQYAEVLGRAGYRALFWRSIGISALVTVATVALAALGNSLKVGVVTALLSTLLGLLAAKAVTQYRLRGTALALGFIGLLLAAIGFPLSLATVVLGHVCLCLPFALAVLIARFEGFDRNLEEASADLGEDGWMTFWRVTFPLMLPGIVASLLLTFITSFDEFLLAYFLSGTSATLPVFIWSQLRFPARLPVVLALGALILLASVVLVVLAEWMRNRGVAPERKTIGA